MAAEMYFIAYDELSSGGGTVWGTSTISVILLTSGYTFDVNDVFISDLSNELAGSGYARQTLGGFTRTLTVDGEVLDGANVTFPSLGAGAGTPAWMILARDTGVDATSPLLGAFQLPGTAPDGTNYTLVMPADGLFLLGPVEGYTLPEMLTFSSGA